MTRPLVVCSAIIFLCLPTLCLAQSPPDVVGDWQGRLGGGSRNLVIIHISKAADGKLTGSLESPDQGVHGMPLDSILFEKGKLKFRSLYGFSTYEGKIKPDGSQISGFWTQADTFPLDFKRVKN